MDHSQARDIPFRNIGGKKRRSSVVSAAQLESPEENEGLEVRALEERRMSQCLSFFGSFESIAF